MNTQPLIEPGFMFSQHSLNTYVRCPRRFLLQYVDRQPWPVLAEDDRGERQEHLARGRLFHQWLLRKQLGVEIEQIVRATSDAQLRRWWQAAEGFAWDDLPASRQVELPIVVPIGDYRLYARYDLVAWSGTEAVVVDWKTLPQRFSDAVAQSRMQTRVYLYTLAHSGHVVLGSPNPKPEDLSMRYWYAEFPGAPSVVGYSTARYAQDRRYLTELVAQITQQPLEAFVPTDRQQLCEQCAYQSWCRNDRPGRLVSQDDAFAFEEDSDFVDVDSAPELEY